MGIVFFNSENGFLNPNNLSQFGLTGTKYCGPGYTDGKFVPPGGTSTYDSVGQNALDSVCRTHDMAVDDARGKPDEAQRIVTADLQLIAATRNAIQSGQISSPLEKQQAGLVIVVSHRRVDG